MLMSELIGRSTSKRSDADLRAIAAYLKDGAASPNTVLTKPDQSIAKAGKTIYVDSCSGGHRSNGDGVPQMFPPLAKNANAQSSDSTIVLRVILQGARTVVTDSRPTPSSMPAYGWKLTDSEVAAVRYSTRSAFSCSVRLVWR